MSPSSTRSGAVSASPRSLIDTLPAWPWLDPLDRSAPRTLGYHAWAWAEGFLGKFHRDDFVGLIQPDGPRGGQRLQLTPRQRRFLLWWYALDDDGGWVFQHGARRLAKGSGKSPFAAVFALTEFCAPVRLDRFDDRVPGGARGVAVPLPLVQIAATAESQTANTMRMVRAFAPKGSPIVEHYSLDPGKTRYYRVPEGTLEVITSSVTASEGAASSAIIGDETEHWKPSNAGPEFASTLIDNLAKSGSRMWETSNAWVPGQECVAEDTYDAWVAQEEGRLREQGARILYDAVMAPPETDLADAESLRAALEFVYEDCWWQQLQPIIGRIWSPKSKLSESKRKYLNWPSAAEDAWILPEQFTALGMPDQIQLGDDVALFFDGSKSRDATALVGCRISDGHVFTLGVWEPDPNGDDVVNVEDVDRVVQLAFDLYHVEAFFADVREWESFALLEWPRRYGDDLRVHSAPHAHPSQAIAWDMRGHTYEFAKACEAVEAEIIDGSFTHDAHPALVRHVINARRRPYRDAVGIGKESKDSPRKIDAAVCMVGARMVRRLVLSAPAPKQRTGVVW